MKSNSDSKLSHERQLHGLLDDTLLNTIVVCSLCHTTRGNRIGVDELQLQGLCVDFMLITRSLLLGIRRSAIDGRCGGSGVTLRPRMKIVWRRGESFIYVLKHPLVVITWQFLGSIVHFLTFFERWFCWGLVVPHFYFQIVNHIRMPCLLAELWPHVIKILHR